MKPSVAILRKTWVAGGAERYLTDLGRALGEDADVHFVGLETAPSESTLSLLGAGDLVSRFDTWPANAGLIEQRAADFRLFVNAASSLWVRGRARHNWLVAFSPGPPQTGPWPVVRRIASRLLLHGIGSRVGSRVVPPRVRLRFALHPKAAQREILGSYDRVVAISRFVSEAVRRRWAVGSDVLYPGVDTTAPQSRLPRMCSIVSVGRFAPYGNHKEHGVLIEAFRVFWQEHPDWTLHLAGSLEATPLCQSYLESLQNQAGKMAIEFHPNISSADLQRLYATSSLYWHGAGFGANPIRQPDQVEQFGMVLVESMASGAVPMAYAAGGVTEIIEDQQSGFLWRTIPDLVRATSRLISTPYLLSDVSRAAYLRSRVFDRQHFTNRVRRWYAYDILEG